MAKMSHESARNETPPSVELPTGAFSLVATPSLRRRKRAEQVRNRFQQLMDSHGFNRSAFARRAGLDRSTLTQILASGETRLPSTETLIRVSESFHVSVDWLLGMRAEPEDGISVLDVSTTLAGGEGPWDSPLLRWYLDAEGQKIRYVPSNLPDILKLDEVTGFEYACVSEISESTMRSSHMRRLDYQRRPETDMECCTSMENVIAFADGRDLWSGLAVDVRHRQLMHMARLQEELYPSFRWFLYEERVQYAPAMTLFGLRRIAFYVGANYLVLTNPAQVRHFAAQFDELVRKAAYQPVDVPRYLRGLARALESGDAGLGA